MLFSQFVFEGNILVFIVTKLEKHLDIYVYIYIMRERERERESEKRERESEREIAIIIPTWPRVSLPWFHQIVFQDCSGKGLQF